ncbi:hypothetical protein BY996DRAFT_8391634 [Phakopsora pachyrhizi]|nr:hypothetical protein BY996DRAFT_8391634 [Phakopsora pachyrhizi]
MLQGQFYHLKVFFFTCIMKSPVLMEQLKNARLNFKLFKTILDELNGGDLQALMPLEQQLGDRSSLLSHGIDWTEEEKIASDFFVGLQKMALPLRIDGLPNIRQVPLNLDSNLNSNNQSIFGSGMPTVDGLRKGLEMMGSIGKQPRMVYWTSMREEPVLYVSGRPHVLRLFDQPLENVVTTGVSAAAVEGMESALKLDVLNELRSHDGRLLLHDEADRSRLAGLVEAGLDVVQAEALKDTDSAIEVDPNFTKAYIRKALTLLAMKDCRHNRSDT